jgi:predicted RecA/RadA family phage recombinase
MATNVIQTDGGHLTKYTTTGAVTAGSLLIVGNTPMLALESATGAGQVIALGVGYAATLTKKAAGGTAITVGGFVTYTATGGVNAVHGSSATASLLVGYGLAAATTAATSAQVRLLAGPARRIG